MNKPPGFIKNYGFSIVLVLSILAGSCLGVVLKENARILKPFGDIFLNLLFTIVVPLVFFSISSAVAGMTTGQRLKAIMVWMLIVFSCTGAIASLFMVLVVRLFPPALGTSIHLPTVVPSSQPSVLEQIVKAVSVTDFAELMSKKNMLALIVFSVFVGLAASASGPKARAFRDFLAAGHEVMGKVVSYVMFYAPIGLGAYFAYLVGTLGSQLVGSYMRVMVLYYPTALIYFGVGFSFYSWLSAGVEGVKKFWSSIIPAALTAWATGSSVATIPTNLAAAKRIGIPEDIREVIIPVGATIHMEGSCLAAIVKIAFLFGLMGMNFSGTGTLCSAVGIALLCGVVMSGIPSGGFLGEMLIVTLYGFPIEALPIISMIGTLVDPPATMVNATGDTVAGMLVARKLDGPGWDKGDIPDGG